jgi:transcriptional regulator with XRE-family HTH domain
MNINSIRKQRASELKNFRLENNLSRQALQRLSGLSRTTIIRIENGTIGWTVDSEIIYFETLKNYNQSCKKELRII